MVNSVAFLAALFLSIFDVPSAVAALLPLLAVWVLKRPEFAVASGPVLALLGWAFGPWNGVVEVALMAAAIPSCARTPSTTPPHTGTVPLARRRASRLVAEWGYPALAADVVALVVSELATNALLHGSLRDRLIRARLTLTASVLRVEVTDTRGERLPRPRQGADTDQFGRGLLLVEALTDRWGSEPRTVGKMVYAEWDLAGRRSGRGDLPVGAKERREWR